MRRNSLGVWSYSKQPLGHQVLAYRNVMRCKWAVRKTARPKNGGRLGTQIRAKKNEARQSGFTFFGPDSGSQNGTRFGAISGNQQRKNHCHAERREKREKREMREERSTRRYKTEKREQRRERREERKEKREERRERREQGEK